MFKIRYKMNCIRFILNSIINIIDTKSLKIVFKVNKQWYHILTQHYFWQQYHYQHRLFFPHRKQDLIHYIQDAMIGFLLRALLYGYTLKTSLLSNDMIKTLCHQLVKYDEFNYKYNTVYIMPNKKKNNNQCGTRIRA